MISAFQQYFANFETQTSTAVSVMLWIILLVLVLYVVLAVTLKGKTKIVNRVFLILGAAIVATALVLFGVLKGKENEADGGVNPLILYPLLAFAIVIVVTAFVLAFSDKKTLRIVFAALAGAALIAVIVCLSVYYASGTPGELNYLSDSDVNTVALWISTAVLVALIIGLSFTDKKVLRFDTRSLAYAGVVLALGFALSYIRIIKMPMGGGITLVSLLPLMLYSYMFGIKKGVLVGIVYGALQAIQDPWILHPAQFLLDYPVAFAGIGLSGLLRETKLPTKVSFALGALVAAAFRLIAHFLSGAFAFGAYASYYDMSSPYLYSITYNAAYVLPDAAMAIIAGVLMMLSKNVSTLVLTADRTPEKKTSAPEKNEKNEDVDG